MNTHERVPWEMASIMLHALTSPKCSQHQVPSLRSRRRGKSNGCVRGQVVVSTPSSLLADLPLASRLFSFGREQEMFSVKDRSRVYGKKSITHDTYMSTWDAVSQYKMAFSRKSCWYTGSDFCATVHRLYLHLVV